MKACMQLETMERECSRLNGKEKHLHGQIEEHKRTVIDKEKVIQELKSKCASMVGDISGGSELDILKRKLEEQDKHVLNLTIEVKNKTSEISCLKADHDDESHFTIERLTN